jgi:ferredoxin-NADP reductase
LGALYAFFPRLTAHLHRQKATSADMQHCPAMHMGIMSKKPVVYEVALKGKKQVAEGTHLFVFEKPAGFHFNAGQHVRMSLIRPPETDAEGNRRFFTMASTPHEPDLVFAMRMRDTAFKRVLNRMQPGERVLIEILLECPHGSFVLHEDTSKPAVFIVGGIGIVPAYSMIKDAIQRNLPQKIFLFYSNRRPEDAPFLAELQNLAEQNPSFKLIATMTKSEKSAQTWRGEVGFINRAMLEKYVDDLRAPIYYVAGLPELVNAMQAVLAEVGVGKNNIRAEEFAGFKMCHDQEASHSGGNHFLIAAIVLVAIVLIALHVGAGISMYHVGLGSFSLHNPIALLLIGLLLAVVAAKVFAKLTLKHFLRSKQGGSMSQE